MLYKSIEREKGNEMSENYTPPSFKEAGFRVENIPFYHRKKYSATEIRNRILNNQSWEGLVPKSVAQLIKETDGVERLRDLAKRDEA